jgi:formate/nitrite transporter FocA (FNT family)
MVAAVATTAMPLEPAVAAAVVVAPAAVVAVSAAVPVSVTSAATQHVAQDISNKSVLSHLISSLTFSVGLGMAVCTAHQLRSRIRFTVCPCPLE